MSYSTCFVTKIGLLQQLFKDNFLSNLSDVHLCSYVCNSRD